MKMYIGNLSYDTTKQDLEALFSPYGAVTDVHLPADRDSGRPRGFAFVTMDSRDAMNKAIEGVNGTDFAGRSLTLNEAQAREERGGGGGGYGGGGGGYGGGGKGKGNRDQRSGGRRY